MVPRDEINKQGIPGQQQLDPVKLDRADADQPTHRSSSPQQTVFDVAEQQPISCSGRQDAPRDASLAPRIASLTDQLLHSAFGDYELLEELGRGGMGVVFKARQVGLNRTIALKTILTPHLAAADQVARFKREAEAAAKLDHPGIVSVYDSGTVDDIHYFSMAYIDGGGVDEPLVGIGVAG